MISLASLPAPLSSSQAVRWSGQESSFKPLAGSPADAKWSQLSDKAKKCMLWATDAMDWNFVQQLVEVSEGQLGLDSCTC